LSFLIDPFQFVKPPEGDEYTKLLLHFDGDNGSSVFIDTSRSQHSYTETDAVLDTSQSKFGGASCYFNGSTVGIKFLNGLDWDFGVDDFTIDFWVRMSSIVADQSLFNAYTLGNFKADFSILPLSGTTGQMLVYINGSAAIVMQGATFSNDTWYHIALVRSGDSWKSYRDGSMYGSGSESLAFGSSTDDITIGTSRAQSPVLNAWIDEFRVSKGIARWTSDFTPPSAPYS